LTIRENPDPLRSDPVSYVDNSCVGCGVCGTNAHSAVLCPSFSRVELVDNPTAWDRMLNATRVRVREWWRVRDRKRMAQRQF
jgi:indolepyruvate ferredoxin oxidoreductase alpha subunit